MLYQDQLKILKNLRCDYYQGYLFSPPLPMEEFLEILQEQNKQRKF
ncbi:MAG TPA: EAL domain-containing protein [Persephonella sp.]|nr:EAL domain-containing protein [Hydrogenothermaceae bacterium]HIQ24709.1 EAL domain-containing protein [Persephonella sp.]